MRNILVDNITILHNRVKVKRKGGIVLARKQLCDFGREINHALIDLNQPKEWLIEQVKEATGRYFDRSYLHKIQTGELSTPGIVTAIRSILKIPDDHQKPA